MVKLSICIPYYKTYELTSQLLDRLIPQLTNETEVILADDGCNETRLDKYKDKINITHYKENKGGATNTNRCIDKAIGEYIALIDCDDIVSEDYVETLINAINESNADLIYMGWQNIETGNIVLHPRNYAVWKCIYRRSKIPRFDDGWEYAFDVPFHNKVRALHLSEYYTEKLLYFYNAGRVDNLTHEKERYLKEHMKYIIMCGGDYQKWETPRHLSKIQGEEIVARTIRLLKENGIKDISISSNNPVFEKFGVPVLKHNNSYVAGKEKVIGDWFDCFYPTDEPTCYILGDVVFSPQAIKTIVETNTDDIELFGSTPPFAYNYCKTHIEAFALKVLNTNHLKQAIEKTRELDKEGKFWRKPIIWELWTVIKDVPLQTVPDEYIYNYTSINDYTCDVDRIEDIDKIEKMIGGKEMVKLEVIQDFTLGRFNEIENLQRGTAKNKEGWLYISDKFECEKDLADYLLGDNPVNKKVVKVLEIVPQKEEVKIEEKKEIKEVKSKPNKKKKSSKK